MPTVEGDVLITLSRISHPLTGRGVARLVPERSVAGVAEALDRLVHQGLVRRMEVPPAMVHTLNRDHLAAPAIEVLAEMRTSLFDRLKGTVGDWEIAPVHVSMFGSAARGDGSSDSDIDLFVVRPLGIHSEDPVWNEQLASLAKLVFDWTGNRASIVDFAASEIQEMLEEAPPILQGLRRDAIDLTGMSLRELLKEPA